MYSILLDSLSGLGSDGLAFFFFFLACLLELGQVCESNREGSLLLCIFCWFHLPHPIVIF